MGQIVNSKYWFLLITIIIMPICGYKIAINEIGSAAIIGGLQVPYLLSIALGWRVIK